MANMRIEIEQLRNLTNLSITLNTPHPEQRANTTIPPSFSPVDSPAPQTFPSNPPSHTVNLNATNSPSVPQQTNPQQTISQQSNPQQAAPPPTNSRQVNPQQTRLQQTIPPQNDPQQVNFQQTHPPSFTAPYIPQPSVIQNTPPTQNYQATQHMPLTHTTSHNTQYVPPVYVAEAQPFTTQLQAVQHPEVDPYEEMEREARARADENVAKELRSLREAVRNIQTNKGCEGLEYEDLCIHPDIELPAGYKVPKFDMFDGKGNPRAHLRSYCDKLVGWEKIRLFG
ncbi:36.4 kDa proline-rich protein-like [Lycium ferocissimum]|uniref:36.4 kDa proline-rich protein-like n=1 Tax=Lycium ferocissimum TaxID=112874 RepID=UPI00281594F6|nr:36.4 kDa proline-rich protein-like [Lycium ferocissimum]